MPTATLQQSCDTARARALTATSRMTGVDPAAQMCCKPAYTRELPEGRQPHKCALSSTCRLMNKGCSLLSSLPACTNIADRAALSCCCASANAVASASAKRAAVACLAGCRFFIMSAISSPAVALLAPATAVWRSQACAMPSGSPCSDSVSVSMRSESLGSRSRFFAASQTMAGINASGCFEEDFVLLPYSAGCTRADVYSNMPVSREKKRACVKNLCRGWFAV